MAKLWAKSYYMHIKYWAYLLDYLAYNMAKYQYFSNDSNNEQKLSLVCIVHDISSFPPSEKTMLGSKILKMAIFAPPRVQKLIFPKKHCYQNLSQPADR